MIFGLSLDFRGKNGMTTQHGVSPNGKKDAQSVAKRLINYSLEGKTVFQEGGIVVDLNVLGQNQHLVMKMISEVVTWERGI